MILVGVDAAVVRPLPFGERSDRLVTLHFVHPTLAPESDLDDAELSFPDLLDVRRESQTLEAVEGVVGRTVAISTGDETRRELAASVTPGLFPMLGVTPAMGRQFTPDDGAAPGFESVVLLSHGVWRDLLGADPGAIGRTIRLNDRPITVIGVMPRGFDFPEEHRLWLPYDAPAGIARDNRGWLTLGLLRPETTLEASADEVAAIGARLAARYPDSNRDWTTRVVPMREVFINVADEGTLLAAVTLLLLVACANIAGLIVARGVGRRHELTVRAALGAGRSRLVRCLLAETAVLAVAGGALGLLTAGWGIRALTAWLPEPPPYWAVPTLDVRVAAVGLAATVFVALLAGLVPAFRLTRVAAAEALVTGVRSAGRTQGHRRLQHALVAGQVSLSFALVVGALLLGRSATALLDADAGFDHRPVLSGRLYLAGDGYDPVAQRVGAVDAIVGRLAGLPGVRAAAATGAIPSDDGGPDIRIVAPGVVADAQGALAGQLMPVTPSFWDALDLTLLEGRTFTASEAADPESDAIIVNTRLAEQLWPGESALDRVLQVVSGEGVESWRVVGVAPDLVYEEFGEITPASRRNVYVPYSRVGWRTQAVLLSIDESRDPSSLADSLRRAVWDVDTGIAVYDVQSMIDRRQYNHWGNQLIGRTMTVFAIAALVLACVGAYGVTSHAAAARRREIGVRLAIGATAADIRRLFVGSGVRLALSGTVLGLPLALLTARVLEGALFRVSPWEGPVWVGLPLLLLAAMVGASYLPARRASRVDPAITLRD